jgi:hypothetical protein
MIYIQKHSLQDTLDYTTYRCRKIIGEHSTIKIHYYRGQYKGYIYIVKMLKYLIAHKCKIRHFELYNHIKTQKNIVMSKYHPQNDFKNGIRDSLYDILNYISMGK